MKIRYYLQGSFTILIGLLMLSVAAVSNAEEITLTTYYPSPYGVYSEMRLYPKASATCNNQQEGLMYYDNNPPSERGLKVCGEIAPGVYAWQLLSSLWTISPSGTNLYPNINSWNVGIGTTDPGIYKLRVNGDLRVDGNVSWSGNLLAGSAVPWQRLTSFPAACPSGQYVRGVGGTLSCDYAVRSVNGMTGSNINIIAGTNITISNSGSTVTISSSGGGGGGSTGSLTVTGSGGSMSPNPWNPGSGTSATLDITGGGGGGGYWAAAGSSIYNTNAGNVGIGTSGPSQKLEVAGNIKAGRLNLGDTNYGINAPGFGTNGVDVGAVTNGGFYVVNSAFALKNAYANDYWVQAANGGAGKWASQLGGGGGGGCNWSGWKCACGADSGGSNQVTVVTALFCSNGVLTDYSNKYVHASGSTSCPASPNPAWGCSSYSYGNY